MATNKTLSKKARFLNPSEILWATLDDFERFENNRDEEFFKTQKEAIKLRKLNHKDLPN